jgi:gluconolactonase
MKFLIFLVLCSAVLRSQSRYEVIDQPPLIVIRDNNAGFEAAIAPQAGGELSSFRVRRNNEWLELLYHARDYSLNQGFAGKGPVLWPAVGVQYPVGTTPQQSCGMGSFTVDGKTYPMPCHGFARSLPWKEVNRSATASGARVTVELRDSDQTRQYYPFAFQLDAIFELSGGHLTIDYVTTSDPANSQPMPLSIGNHIAFKIPFLPGTNPADMTIRTPNSTQLLRDRHNLPNGLSKENSFDQPRRLGDFDASVALPLAGYRSTPYALLSDPQGLAVRVAQQSSELLPEPLDRFHVYGGPKVGYFCPEPWFGLINSLNTRKGAVTLKPGDNFKWRVELSIETPPPDLSKASPGVERVAGGFAFTEGPVWTHQNELIFSDIYNSRIMKWNGTGAPEIYRNFSNATNGNSMDSAGRLYSCVRDKRAIMRQEKDGSLKVIASQWRGNDINSPNDIVVRRDGHVYFSDPVSKGVLAPQKIGFAGVFHVTSSGDISLVTDKLPRPNGVALTLDGKTLYVADSTQRKIYAFDLDASGAATNQRVAISDIPGTPDGLRVAANGNLYIACKGIGIYTPAGKLIQLIDFPETPTNCTFGGSDLRTLYVTASTSIYRVQIPDQGALLY